jgi:1-acyl-sn-glycerol-3-phosphate acyltransferase
MRSALFAALLNLKGAFTFSLCVLNTVVVFVLLMPFAIVKRLVPLEAVRKGCDRALVTLATGWVWFNSAYIATVNRTRWSFRGVDALRMDEWYMVISNHASWVDIAVLQRAFLGQIPFLKFFLKQELIWVPLLGLAWWALDLPFLKRKKGTSLKGAGGSNIDLETTRRACEKFKLIPTSVINFCEGTRFTPVKHAKQRSPYAHLLKPKSGGMAVALSTMGAQFHTVLDVTVHYVAGIPTMWDYLSDRVPAIVVDVQTREIPAALLDPAAQADPRYRAQVQAWLDELWAEKDALLGRLAAEAAAAR